MQKSIQGRNHMNVANVGSSLETGTPFLWFKNYNLIMIFTLMQERSHTMCSYISSKFITNFEVVVSWLIYRKKDKRILLGNYMNEKVVIILGHEMAIYFSIKILPSLKTLVIYKLIQLESPMYLGYMEFSRKF